MSAPLTPEENHRYTLLIDAILQTADLETVSRKKVRKGLEKALGKDLRDQKVAITALIEARFDAINTQSQSNDRSPSADVKDEEEETNSTTKRSHSSIEEDDDDDGANGVHDSDSRSEIKVSLNHQPKKKHKRSSSSVEDADARLAAELQAQENRLARARTTRGGGPAKAKPRKKAPKKKSAAKIKDDDDSEAESDDSSAVAVVKEKRKAGGGFQKPFNLSYQLGELVGETQLSRPQVVKKLWEHIKGNSLQDPNDRRQIICDEKMQAVFKQSKVDMFQMNKLLGNHLYPVDEE